MVFWEEVNDKLKDKGYETDIYYHSNEEDQDIDSNSFLMLEASREGNEIRFHIEETKRSEMPVENVSDYSINVLERANAKFENSRKDVWRIKEEYDLDAYRESAFEKEFKEIMQTEIEDIEFEIDQQEINL